MAEVDLEKVRKLAESAQLRAKKAHTEYMVADKEATEHQRCMRNLAARGVRMAAQDHLNDSFYWYGHANAYKGIVAMVELATVVEDELESEGTCP